MGLRFWLQGSRFHGGVLRMGAKYLPTIKDLKAAQRFQQKHNPLPFTKKPSGLKPVKKSKPKG